VVALVGAGVTGLRVASLITARSSVDLAASVFEPQLGIALLPFAMGALAGAFGLLIWGMVAARVRQLEGHLRFAALRIEQALGTRAEHRLEEKAAEIGG